MASRPETSLREVQSVADLTAHAVVLRPAQVRQIDATLQHEILHEAAHGIVGQRGNDRRAQAETAPQAARDVVLAAAFPGPKRSRRVNAIFTGVQAKHDLAEAHLIETAVRWVLQGSMLHRPIHPPSTTSTWPFT